MIDFEIKHQTEEQLFYVHLDDGQRAFLKYRFSDDKSASSVVDFWSTFVPDSYRGKGLAAKLVQAGFAWAEHEGMHVKASCWYAAKKLTQQS